MRKIFLFFVLCTFSLSATENRENKAASEKKVPGTRSYDASITEQEKENIRFIIMTLATKSQVALLFEKGALNQAGNRVEHVHPLKFLSYIFSESALRRAVVKIKGIAWNRFVNDMGENLAKEANRNNLKKEYIADFAQTVGVSESKLGPLAEKGQWQEFINTVRANI